MKVINGVLIKIYFCFEINIFIFIKINIFYFLVRYQNVFIQLFLTPRTMFIELYFITNREQLSKLIR